MVARLVGQFLPDISLAWATWARSCCNRQLCHQSTELISLSWLCISYGEMDQTAEILSFSPSWGFLKSPTHYICCYRPLILHVFLYSKTLWWDVYMDVVRFMWPACEKVRESPKAQDETAPLSIHAWPQAAVHRFPSAGDRVVFRAHILKLGCKHMDMMDFKAGKLSMWSQWSSRIDLRDRRRNHQMHWICGICASGVLSDRATETLKGGNGFLGSQADLDVALPIQAFARPWVK